MRKYCGNMGTYMYGNFGREHENKDPPGRPSHIPSILYNFKIKTLLVQACALLNKLQACEISC